MRLTSRQQRLIEQHMPVVYAIAHEAANRFRGSLTFAEASASAAYGACRAAITYDPAKGTAFSTHIYRRAKHQVIDDMRDRNHWFSRNSDRAGRGKGVTPKMRAIQRDADARGDLSCSPETAVVDACDELEAIFRTAPDGDEWILRQTVGLERKASDIGKEIGACVFTVYNRKRDAMIRASAAASRIGSIKKAGPRR